MELYGLDSSGLGYGPVEVTCEQVNLHRGSIKYCDIL
jgi:hypothetical protein